MQGLEALAPGIAASPSLRCLNLEGKGITAAGCLALRDAVAQRSGSSGGGGLEELFVGRNSIGGAGLEALLAAFGGSLQLLDLSTCGLVGDADLAPLAAALSQGQLPRLQSLQLDGNDLSEAEQLGASLAASSCGALRHLHLQRCTFGGSGVARLAAALPAGLESLDLSGNAVGSEGAVALAEALAAGGGRQLRKLALCGCGLDDAGVAALASALAGAGAAAGEAANGAAGGAAGSAAGGVTLDLSGNAAGPAAVAALASAPLAGLCLHDCQLGSGEGGGAAALAEQLAAAGAFAQLAELDVSANHMEAGQLLPLLVALTQPTDGGSAPATCPRLRLLVIAANPGAASEEALAAVERLQGQRRELDVVRRAADTGEGGMMGS